MVLDREALRKTAASRRAESAEVIRQRGWHCEHCLRDWQTELGFMNHRCQERERIEELKTPRGQAAYAYYCEWMRQHKRSVPAIETFMTSKQYNYFMKFSDWSDKTAIPNPNQFIKLMVETGTQPVLWCRDNTYAMYLQWYDNVYPPVEQFLQTLDRLVVMATDYGCPINEIYTTIGAAELAKLVRRRKLSPWLLATSSRFLKFVTALPAHERDMLNDAINFGTFAAKLNANSNLALEFRNACESEGV
jgi:hypothetical protein